MSSLPAVQRSDFRMQVDKIAVLESEVPLNTWGCLPHFAKLHARVMSQLRPLEQTEAGASASFFTDARLDEVRERIDYLRRVHCDLLHLIATTLRREMRRHQGALGPHHALYSMYEMFALELYNEGHFKTSDMAMFERLCHDSQLPPLWDAPTTEAEFKAEAERRRSGVHRTVSALTVEALRKRFSRPLFTPIRRTVVAAHPVAVYRTDVSRPPSPNDPGYDSDALIAEQIEEHQCHDEHERERVEACEIQSAIDRDRGLD